MCQEPPPESEEGTSKGSPHKTLHLLPSAPRELVVEVYWHLVGQLQAAAKETPHLRGLLDDLNEAYRVLMTEVSQDSGGPAAPAQRRGGSASAPLSRGWSLRRFRRQQEESAAPEASPWELLHIDRDAPADLVDLALGFWRSRHRAGKGDSTSPGLEELEQALRSVRGTRSDELPEADDGRADIAPSAVEPIEAVQKQASAPVFQRVRRAGARMFAVLRGRPPTTLRTSPEEPVASAGVGSPDESDATASPVPTEHEAQEPLPSTEGLSVHGPLEDTAEAPDVPEFLSREMISDESETASDGEAPTVATEADEREELEREPVEALSETAGDTAKNETPSLSVSEQRRMEPTPSAHAENSHAPLGPDTRLGSLARLVPKSGSELESGGSIGQEAIGIGASPTHCIILTASNSGREQVEARIWRQNDQFILHATRSDKSVLVNGRAVVWAVLEHGDTLQAGGRVFRFEFTRNDVSCIDVAPD